MLCSGTSGRVSTLRTMRTAASSRTRAVHRFATPAPASAEWVTASVTATADPPTTAAIASRAARRPIRPLRTASSAAPRNKTICTALITVPEANAERT